MKEDGLGETDCSLAHLVSRHKRIRCLSLGQYEVGVHHAGSLEGRHQSVQAMKEATIGSSCGNMKRYDDCHHAVWRWAFGKSAGMTLKLPCCCEH